MVYDGNLFFWEHDRGTEDFDQLNEKLTTYFHFQKATGLKFTVLFTIADYRYGTYSEDRTQTRIKQLLTQLVKRNMGTLFAVAHHFDLVGHPFKESTPLCRVIHNDTPGDILGEHFRVPMSPEKFSLLDLV